MQINIKTLFRLAASHSTLAQAEYNRNPSFNDEHPAQVAEKVLIEELRQSGKLDQLLEYITSHERVQK